MSTDRTVVAGISSNAIQDLALTALVLQMAAAGTIIGGALGALAGGGSAKAAGIGAVIGAIVVGSFGGFAGYEAKAGPT